MKLNLNFRNFYSIYNILNHNLSTGVFYYWRVTVKYGVRLTGYPTSLTWAVS
jgi:hypothetical protein